MATTIRIQVPESFREILSELASDEAGLSQWSFEALVIEAYREGLITRAKIGEILGLSFHKREAWLKEREVPYLYDEKDLEEDRKTLDNLPGW